MRTFLQGLQELGWTIGRNIEIEYRWAPGDVDNSRRNAEELVALAPDVILATGGVNMGPLLQVTRTVPIVFVQVTDPVGAGYVQSLALPNSNGMNPVALPPGRSGVRWATCYDLLVKLLRRAGCLVAGPKHRHPDFLR
jgi:putative ABC transport system substrate-binding protein